MCDEVSFHLNSVEVNFECVNVTIVCMLVKTKNFNVYKKPLSKNEDFSYHFEKYLVYLNASKSSFLVCRVFNIDTLDCKSNFKILY